MYRSRIFPTCLITSVSVMFGRTSQHSLYKQLEVSRCLRTLVSAVYTRSCIVTTGQERSVRSSICNPLLDHTLRTSEEKVVTFKNIVIVCKELWLVVQKIMNHNADGAS